MPSSSRPTERQRVTDPLLKALKKRGAFAVKIHGGPFQRRGLLDILVCYRGRFLMFEAKRTEEMDASAIQHYQARLIEAAGGVAVVVRNVEHAMSYLDEIDAELDGDE